MPAVRTAVVVGLMTVGLLIAAAAAQSQSVATGGWMHDFRQAEAEARRQNKPLLVHFYAEWCAPCKRMDREFLHSPELLSRLGHDFLAVKVNRDGNDDLVERFGIRVLPSDVILSPSGAVLARSQGYKDRRTYFATLASIGGGRDKPPVQIVKETAPRVQPVSPGGEEDAERSAAQVGLAGFCPVTLWKERRWQRGKPEFTARYQDIVFFLANADQVREFNTSPGRYVPQLLGCDPVVLAETDRALAGSTRFGAYYDGELFLFSSESTRQRFRAHPGLYTRIRHVLRIDDIEPTPTRHADAVRSPVAR